MHREEIPVFTLDNESLSKVFLAFRMGAKLKMIELLPLNEYTDLEDLISMGKSIK